MRIQWLARAGMALPLVLLAACGGGGGNNNSDNSATTGELNLSVTDAAVDSAQRVLVQFTGVAVKPGDADAIDLPLSGDSQTCQDLLDGVPPSATPEGESPVRCIDLLELQGTESATLLDGAILEAGMYGWMRLDVDARKGVMDSIIVLDDGSVESLYVPSGSESGLKLNSGFTILVGGTHDFVIDFDLRKSVHDPKGQPDYFLRPSLRLVDLAESGRISSTVAASMLTADNCTPDAYAVYVYEGGALAEIGDEGSDFPPLTSAAVMLKDGEWHYTVGFLPPGDYAVAFTCEAGNDDPETADDIAFVGSPDSPVTVEADHTSVVNFNP